MATLPEADDFRKDPEMSLREKWRRHVEIKKQSEGLNSTGGVLFLNRWGPRAFFFIVFGNVWWISTYSIPNLYEEYGYDEQAVLWAWLFIAFAIVQLLINWCLVRWVSSEYKPSVHGTRPPDFPLFGIEREQQKEETERKLQLQMNQGEFHTNHDLMPSTNAGSVNEGGFQNSGNNLLSSTQGPNAWTGSGNMGQNGFPTLQTSDGGGAGAPTHGSTMTSSPAVGARGAGGDDVIDLDYAPPDPEKKDGYYDGFSYRMLVATSLPDQNGDVQRKAYPYWSWAPCLLCQRLRPPRCHHCVLCGKCLLKRDHHCYLIGVCIANNNMRFFIQFVFWAFVIQSFGIYNLIPSTLHHLVPEYGLSYFDFVPPIALVRGLLGYISLLIFVLGLAHWSMIMTGLASVFMLIGYARKTLLARTTFEDENGIVVLDTRSFGARVRSVFGPYWWLGFVIPVPTNNWFELVEDPVLWPDIKPW